MRMASRLLFVAAVGALACGSPKGSADAGQQDAGSIDAGAVAPLATGLSFACETYNIGALATQDPSMGVNCTAGAVDSFGHAIPNPPIHFLAEAGTMTYTSAGSLVYLPHDPNAIHPAPNDVAPEDLDGLCGQGTISSEPFWMSQDGFTHNPRDGLATIVAYIEGDPAAVAEAGLGEPYVDANDNKKYDPGEDFVDLNGNGQWDATQSIGPGSTNVLWMKLKVLWTGAVDGQMPLATQMPPDVSLTSGQDGTLVLSVVDSNFNVIACYGVTDGITWTATPAGSVSVTADGMTGMTTPETRAGTGMLLDSNFDFVCAVDEPAWGIGGSVAITLLDQYVCPGSGQNASLSVQGAVACTPFPDGSQAADGTVTAAATLDCP
jgi:hypothetical protein